MGNPITEVIKYIVSIYIARSFSLKNL